MKTGSSIFLSNFGHILFTLMYFFSTFLLDQKSSKKSQVGRISTAQPRRHRLPTLPPAPIDNE